MNKDWWKWGNPKAYEHVNNYPKLKQICIDRFGMDPKEDFHPPHEFNVPVVSEEVQQFILNAFKAIPTTQIDFSKDTRLTGALGKSYHDVIRIFKDHNIQVPDVVLQPRDHDDVQAIITAADQHNIAIVPIGGQTNVVGALTMEKDLNRKVAYLDLSLMSKLLSIDKENLLATFQAGVFGPHLEDQLKPYGLTLGHFPQSFEFSTLGGWVVTRSAGQESTYYGKIEDMVVSLKVATPKGTIQTPSFDKDAEGINLTSTFIGSEGLLGTVTEVTVKLHKKPVRSKWVLALFPDFESGSNCLKEVIQNDIYPSVCRLSDGPETYFYSQLKPEKQGVAATLKKKVEEIYLNFKNIEEPNIMMLRFEEVLSSKENEMAHVQKIITQHKGALIPSSLAKNWEATRFHTPYLRDTMMEHRIFIDTMETVVSWDKVMTMHAAVTKALQACEAFHKEKGIIMSHISHIYTHGACMYFILICPMNVGQEVEQWEAIKKTVSDAIVHSGGSISHHHSIGKDHQSYYLAHQDKLGLQLLKAMKQQVDPNDILNPGKLFDV
ncbi:MAG: FAD-binding oxidoreductase [Bacteroidetes bacterium]|nr:FAD-binding oxidoreductase [Bacteroidota bacterium]